MEELIQLLKDTFSDRLKQVVLSNSKDKEKISKVKIRPILLKDKLVFQESAYIGTKVFHENYTEEKMAQKTAEYMNTIFKQAEIETNHRNFFCFSIMKTMPLAVQPTIYNDGRYNRTGARRNEVEEVYRTNKISTTFEPCRAAATAAQRPDIPPPITHRSA